MSKPTTNVNDYPVHNCGRAGGAHAPHEWTRGLGAYISEKRDSWCEGDEAAPRPAPVL